ncbi:rhomboid family protein [Pedobacter puniceum]|uniref:Rhomboid family intramembrane serine protease n=1 Tax=Pedobacter puniceum TaxID=2666136 RepID=A0A7K0FRQ1_9SPHI|nr:rhomboid family intramembrane serine protease [Pedobacter puniceum]MRX47980.1 rhomboid family intramembrane serine protease [Pedobacter puniceum]
MNTIQELRYKIFNSGSRVNLFIGINVIVFLAFNLIRVVQWLFTRQTTVYETIIDYLAVPTYTKELLFKFWTPFTYMFLHNGVFHILFNMLWLFWMGRIFEEFLNSKKLTFVYLAGGLAGAFLFIVSYNFLPAFSNQVIFATAVGASAAVTAIIVATATLLPDYTISLLLFGPVKLKWIALIYIVLDIISLAGANAGGHMAHLGGAIFGFLYIKSLQNGRDWSKPFINLFKPHKKLKVVSKNYNKPYQENIHPDQKTIDEILDKISQSGYDKLTKREKEILFRASKSNEEK